MPARRERETINHFVTHHLMAYYSSLTSSFVFSISLVRTFRWAANQRWQPSRWNQRSQWGLGKLLPGHSGVPAGAGKICPP